MMQSVNLSPNYNPIAYINNEYYSQQYVQRTLPIIKQNFLDILPSNANILDLCCGVGRLVEQLLLAGYQVTGIDSSEEMLRYARQNAPRGQFIWQDARRFHLPARFDGVVSTGALNHIITLDDITNVFRNVYNSLHDHGVFIFNLLLEEGFNSWDGYTFGDAKENCAWIVRQEYHSEAKLGNIKITGFQLIENSWQRLDDIMPFKAYAEEEIKTALQSVGFQQIEILALDNGVAKTKADGEVYFVSRK